LIRLQKAPPSERDNIAGLAFDRYARVLAIFWRLPGSALNSEVLPLFGRPTSAMWKVSRIMAGELAGHARPHPGPQTRQILRDCRLSARYVAAFRYFPEGISTETEPAL
jgi:hypothetical protein